MHFALRRRTLQVDEIYPTERAYLKGTGGPKRRGGLTLEDAWTRYHASLAFREKKTNTQRAEETHIKASLARLGNWAVADIGPDEVEGLILAGLDAKRAPDTIRNQVATLSSVMKFCLERTLIARNPCIGVKRPRIERKVRRMAPGDEGALMKLLALHSAHRQTHLE